MFLFLCKPGDRISETGVFRVHHTKHRVPHYVLVEKGTVLPACAQCGARVRFEHYAPTHLTRRTAVPIRFDIDFWELKAA